MTKEEALNSLVQLYCSSNMTDTDRCNFEAVARHINDIHDNKGILEILDDYERYLKIVVEALPVSVLAKLCGLSRTHIYSLLANNSRLHILKKYYPKNW